MKLSSVADRKISNQTKNVYSPIEGRSTQITNRRYRIGFGTLWLCSLASLYQNALIGEARFLVGSLSGRNCGRRRRRGCLGFERDSFEPRYDFGERGKFFVVVVL